MATLAGLIPAQSLVAAEPAEIVVIATPLSSGDSADPARTIPAKALASAHTLSAVDALDRFTPGIFLNAVQGNPLQPDVSYHGYTASPLLGTPQGLSLYVDGVRTNQPFGDVISWDLIPTSAIRTLQFVPSPSPLFGRNSIGGALTIVTKDGRSDPGMTADVSHGSFGRTIARATVGGEAGRLNWFGSADYVNEHGWRDHSPSRAGVLFGKLGWTDGGTEAALSTNYADTDLSGNGLQEMRLLDRDRRSVYTYPDTTRNRASVTVLTLKREAGSGWTLSANAFYRRLRARTFNGDVNDEALGENLYQPNRAERAALAAAGYTGVPLAGESQANTPFPRFRCIANVLLNSEPNEKCDGLANRSATRQREWGGTAELAWTAGPSHLTLGLAYVHSRSQFAQSSQFGYLTADRGVVAVSGPGAFADGTQDSENAFDARVDVSGRTTAIGLYAAETLQVTPGLTADLSGRFDRTVIRSRDAITPGGGPGSLDGRARYARFNPALALRWTARPGLDLSAAVAQTSRTPSAIELGCADPATPCRLPNAMAGDPPLQDVVARTVELRGSYRWKGIGASIGLFRTVNRRDILFVADDQAGFGYFRNFGRTRRQGVDVQVSGTFGPLQLTASYTFLDATYRTAETLGAEANSSADGGPGLGGDIAISKGDRLPLIPRHLFKAGVTWQPVRMLSLSADMVAASGTIARGNENGGHSPDGVYYLGPGRTRPYAVVNVGADLHVASGVTLYAQVDNLLDRRYATAAQLGHAAFDANGSFVARPFAATAGGERPLLSSTFYAPGAPRSVMVGARLAF